MTKRNGQYNATGIFKAERGERKEVKKKKQLVLGFWKTSFDVFIFDAVVGRFCIFITMYSQTYV